MSNRKRMTLNLAPDVADALVEHAKRTDVPMSRTVDAALRVALALPDPRQPPSAAEA